MRIDIDEKAPTFSLYDQDGSQISLEDYRDQKVLLLFFPLAFTSVYTTELSTVRDELQEYNDLGVKVIAISVDSPFTLKKFKEEQGYNFTLASDFNKEVSRAYGALYEEFVLEMQGVSKTAAFVINESGTVIYEEVLDNADQIPDFQAIKMAIKEEE